MTVPTRRIEQARQLGLAVTVGPAVHAIGRVALLRPPSARRSLVERVTTRWQRRSGPAAELPGLIDLLTRALRSGRSVQQAVADAADQHRGELRPDLVRCRRALESGASLPAALDRLAIAVGDPGMRMIAAVLGLSIESGGAISHALSGVGTAIRDQLAVATEVRALTSQAIFSAYVLAVLPIGFAALMAAVDPAHLSFLLTQRAGQVCLFGGLLLDVVGIWWMRRVIGRHA